MLMRCTVLGDGRPQAHPRETGVLWAPAVCWAGPRVPAEPHFHDRGVHTARWGGVGQDLLSHSPPETLPPPLLSCLESRPGTSHRVRQPIGYARRGARLRPLPPTWKAGRVWGD